MPGALTHTRITWSFSPMALQVFGVTPGSLLCPWCGGHSLWRGVQHSILLMFFLIAAQPSHKYLVSERLLHMIHLVFFWT
jgi:hypothetical protein